MSRTQPAPPVIQAAGGVLWRPADGSETGGSVEVAVIHRPRYDDWSLPKGKLTAGEKLLEAAIREVREETGHLVRVGRSLGSIRYQKIVAGKLRDKVVHWWAMRADGGVFVPNDEVDALRWLPVGAADAALTRDLERVILERFAEADHGLGGVVSADRRRARSATPEVAL